jgi:DNA-binding NarL/FixJ family response regulator
VDVPAVPGDAHRGVTNPLNDRTAVLVDQHPLWLDTVEELLSRVGVRVLAKITSSRAALDLIDTVRPELVITGVKMDDGDLDGIDLVRAVREHSPAAKIVVLSMYEDADHIDAAFSAGADAYVFKSAHPDDLAAAVRQAFEHSIYLAYSRRAARPAPALDDKAARLTRRELEILCLVGEGHSNAHVARSLWVTEQTVKFHLSNVYRKLGVSNRTEASRWAQSQGLLGELRLQAAEAA